MFDVTAQADIATSPQRIWRVLTDFARYQEWHPFAAIAGIAIAGAEIDYTLKILAVKLGTSAIRMKIVRCEPPSYVAWKFGASGMMWLEEWYRLDAQAFAGNVRRQATCRLRAARRAKAGAP